MQDITELHLDECDAAMTEQNAAIEAAREAFEEALRMAQATYAAKLTESRQRAWSAIQERLRVWNGFGPAELPPAAGAGVQELKTPAEEAPPVQTTLEPVAPPHQPHPRGIRGTITQGAKETTS